MPTKKKAIKKVVEEVVAEPTPAEKIAAAALAWRKKRERVHHGLTNANVEDANA